MSELMTVVPQVKVFDCMQFPDYVQEDMYHLFDDIGAGVIWHAVGDDPDDITDMFLIAHGADPGEIVLLECFPEE